MGPSGLGRVPPAGQAGSHLRRLYKASRSCVAQSTQFPLTFAEMQRLTLKTCVKQAKTASALLGSRLAFGKLH